MRNRLWIVTFVFQWIWRLLIFVIITGCAVLKASDIPKLDESYPLTYTIQKPVVEVWVAVLEEILDQKPTHGIFHNNDMHMVSWTDKIPSWDKCDNFEKVSRASTALTVVRLTSASAGTHVFIRRTCYSEINSKDDHALSHGRSLGVYENSFIKALYRRLGI